MRNKDIVIITEEKPSFSHRSFPASAEMQNRLLARWNATEYRHPLYKCIHELFEERVDLSPDAVAVECNGNRITFRELNNRANKVAWFLRKRGVVPNMFVGISVERSLEMLIGIYGILKAGGAYVPIDPIYPQERLQYMLGAAKIRILLTQQRLIELFKNSPDVDIIRLDSDWTSISTEDDRNPEPVATADDLIYLIFTSGSTGRPKGAAVYHRGFTNLLLWFVTEFGITHDDRNLLVSSLSFDLTQKNLYAPLICGGRLHLAPTGPYDAQVFSRLIQDYGITLINCTPSAFYPLIESPSDEGLVRLSSMRVVFLGGEPISIPRLRRWMIHPSCRAEVANTYGPTECTDICGSYRMTPENMDQYEFVPLGRPIHNVQLMIVDDNFKPCRIGEAGELCVAGAGIGAGYINDPEMTAAKFVANPFPDIAGAKVYRTGDQARWLPAGVIEFLGRLDHQVKIRGFRIELHEIESVLKIYPDIRDAVVLVRKGLGGDENARLVCYVMLRKEAKTDTEEIRRYLSEHLPDFMIPSIFHILDKFPLSPNGKVDRQAIQLIPEPDLPLPRKPITAPENDLEQRIAEIWIEILGLSHIGMDENFFDVGGNSIQLAQLHSRLLALVEKEFPITDLLVYTTIRAAAAFLAKDKKFQTDSVHSIQDRARRQRAVLSTRRNLRFQNNDAS